MDALLEMTKKYEQAVDAAIAYYDLWQIEKQRNMSEQQIAGIAQRLRRTK